MKSNYDSNSIQILEGLEAIRKRPGMYIGSTDIYGLHQLIWEIIDNSVDEVLSGFCTKISIIINNDDSITIIDNGRGIPIDIHPKTQVSTLETVFTILHSGSKFDSNTYKISGGLHGVGASVVNALSSYLKVEVSINNKKYKIEFHKGGKILNNIKEIGWTNDKGTSVTFIPDKNIFKETTIFNLSIINNRVKQLSFLNKGLEMEICDFRNGENKHIVYKFDNGIKDYILDLNKSLGSIPISSIFYVYGIEQNIIVECSLQYNNSCKDNYLFSFCNNINTYEGGTHEEGVKQAIMKELNNYSRLFLKNKINFNKYVWDDVKEGLTCVISIRHPNPQYEGQTKKKLGNSEVRKIVTNIISNSFNNYLLENPNDAKNIFNKINLTLKTRIAAQHAKDNIRRKSLIDNFSLPGKLTDCEIKDSKIAELFIVEGSSAGGSAKSGRNRKFQAILPLRGKILNVEKANFSKIFENNEIISIIKTLGCGINDNFKKEKLRYNKIIIMTDADVDGAHIRILLLTFFFRYMKKVIENGNAYIAQPPLYKIQYGKNIKYLYSDSELEKEKYRYKQKNINNYVIQRYKGLGEMNSDQLWETTMNPKNRLLLKVLINDAIKANTIFSELMGENVELRKKFIKENAIFVKNIDV